VSENTGRGPGTRDQVDARVSGLSPQAAALEGEEVREDDQEGKPDCSVPIWGDCVAVGVTGAERQQRREHGHPVAEVAPVPGGNTDARQVEEGNRELACEGVIEQSGNAKNHEASGEEDARRDPPDEAIQRREHLPLPLPAAQIRGVRTPHPPVALTVLEVGMHGAGDVIADSSAD